MSTRQRYGDSERQTRRAVAGPRGIVVLLSMLLLTSASAYAQDEGTPIGGAAGDGDAATVPAESGSTPAVDATPTEGDDSASPATDAQSTEDASRARLATDQRLREIGNQVDTLKEETFATKSRLLLLRESVLRRSVAGAKLVVVHQNEMGGEYELVQLLYALDRDPRYSKLDYTGELDGMDRTVVIDESVVPGSHILMSRMVFKGSTWGIFGYMDGYTFTIESSFAFTAEEGKAHLITVRAYEGGGFFTPLEERPSIAYELSTQALDELDTLSAAND